MAVFPLKSQKVIKRTLEKQQLAKVLGHSLSISGKVQEAYATIFFPCSFPKQVRQMAFTVVAFQVLPN